MVGQQQPIFLGRGAHQRRAERRLMSQVAHRDPLGERELLNLRFGARVTIHIDVLPRQLRAAGMTCTGWPNCSTKCATTLGRRLMTFCTPSAAARCPAGPPADVQLH